MEEVNLESLEDVDINELTDINEIKKFHGCFLRKEVSQLELPFCLFIYLFIFLLGS